MNGDNPCGALEVRTEGDETPVDAYNVAMALGIDGMTEEEREALGLAYSDAEGERQESDTSVESASEVRELAKELDDAEFTRLMVQLRDVEGRRR